MTEGFLFNKKSIARLSINAINSPIVVKTVIENKRAPENVH